MNILQFLPSNLVRPVLAVLTTLVFSNFAVGQSPNVKLPEGFVIERIADDSIATNIFSLTIAPNGDPIVSGPGYIKRLVNNPFEDNGIQRAELLSDVLKSGAQGMCFDGDDLLAVGDGGLWRIDVKNGSPPRKLLSLKTGGEHDSHAIRKGPFGYWYLICGNGVPIGEDFYNDPNSPIKDPRAGFLMRISPDWKSRAIIADGFRNAYDFDFNRNGEIFVYDSDGERDVSLPWYRPTRVFKIRPGDDAGFVTPSWKRPSYFLDMPEEIGEAGRGSPTGVCVFDGISYFGMPQNDRGMWPGYDQTVFAADWTFGRIMAYRRDEKTGRYGSGEDFAIAQGDFGFAVTDIAQRGDFLIATVGGRGTQGGVYQIWRPGSRRNKTLFHNDNQFQEIEANSLPPGDWNAEDVDRLLAQLESDDLRQNALDTLVGRTHIPFADHDQRDSFVEILNRLIEKDSPETRRPLFRILSSMDTQQFPELFESRTPLVRVAGLNRLSATDVERWQAIAICLNSLNPSPGLDRNSESSEEMWLVRLAQLAAGDCQKTNFAPVFDGYSCRLESWNPESARESNEVVALIAKNLQSADPKTRQELGRLAAMLRLNSNELNLRMSKYIAKNSHPVDDIHWLICLAKQQGYFPPLVEQRIADGLLGLEGKLTELDLQRDRNWVPRMRDLCTELFKRLSIGKTVAGSPDFGMPGHGFIYDSLPRTARDFAATQFVAKVARAPKDVTADQLSVLVSKPNLVPKSLFRKLAARAEFRNRATQGLTHNPVPEDEELFAQALKSGNYSLVRQSALALTKIDDQREPEISMNALAALRKLPWEKRSVDVRDALVGLLQSVHGPELGYQFKMPDLNQDEAIQAWESYLAALYPLHYEEMFVNRNVVAFEARLSQVQWNEGEIEKGWLAFHKFQCANCHDGGSRLGPKLEGITKRFSQRDLFLAIVKPNEQVAERYRAQIVQTVDGNTYRGATIYESVDGITLLESSGETIRINQDEIEEKTLSQHSLMPTGLLDEATREEIADLYAYLKSQ